MHDEFNDNVTLTAPPLSKYLYVIYVMNLPGDKFARSKQGPFCPLPTVIRLPVAIDVLSILQNSEAL